MEIESRRGGTVCGFTTYLKNYEERKATNCEPRTSYLKDKYSYWMPASKIMKE